MSTRTLIAAAALTIFAGAAAAEGENQIDYTSMYSSNSRAEVMADSGASTNMLNNSASFHGGEAYGYFNPQLSMSDTTRAEVKAEAIDFRIDNSSSSYVMTNEAYNGVSVNDMFNGENSAE